MYPRIYLVFLEHDIAVNEALLEGHPVPLQPLQLKLHLLRNLHFVLPEDVEPIMQGLKLGLSVGNVIL